jgi:ribonuclease HI
VWSDGSCIHPLDPLLARAAWGLRIAGKDDAIAVDLAGPVNGVQTAQRAEVTAALAAVRAVSQPIELVTDSRYVVRSLASIAAGACPAEWLHADVWTQLVPHARQGRIRARWTPANKSAEEYARRGLLEEDRAGNAAADKNCGDAAEARLPPAVIVQQRMECVEALGQAQRVIAFTELAALRANHGNGVAAVPRIKRRWADVRRGVRKVQKASGLADGNATAGVVTKACKPESDPPPPMHALSMRGGTLSCSACGKTAVKSRWTALAYGKCSANADGEHWTWRRQPHQVVERDGVIGCTRCGGSVPMLRRPMFEGRQCPAWRATAPAAPGGDAESAFPAAAQVAVGSDDWGAWILGLLGHNVAGGRQATKGGQKGVTVTALTRSDAHLLGAQTILSGTAWRPHISAQGPNFIACLVCGGTARGWAKLHAAPCSSWRDVLPPRVAALTMLGDQVARACGPEAAFFAALDARRGERPRPPE